MKTETKEARREGIVGNLAIGGLPLLALSLFMASPAAAEPKPLGKATLFAQEGIFSLWSSRESSCAAFHLLDLCSISGARHALKRRGPIGVAPRPKSSKAKSSIYRLVRFFMDDVQIAQWGSFKIKARIAIQ